MEAIFRYPIFDFRALYSFKESSKSWNFKNCRFKVLEGIGSIRFVKNTGGLVEKGAKRRYSFSHGYTARQAIKFPNLSNYAFEDETLRIVPQVRQRLFLPKNMFTSCYQIELFSQHQGTFDDFTQVEQIIRHFRGIVGKTSEGGEHSLPELAPKVRRLYYASLTRIGIINRIKAWLLKKASYTSSFTQKDVDKLVKGAPLAVFTFRSGVELSSDRFEKICTVENVDLFRLKIEGRMSVWVINPKDGRHNFLVELLRNFILDTEQAGQTVEYIARYIRTNRMLRFNEKARNRILRLSMNRFFTGKYFNHSGKYSAQQQAIRKAILSSIQKNSVGTIKDFLKVKNVHLRWKTLFMLYDARVWKQVFVDLLSKCPEQSVKMEPFFAAVEKGEYLSAIKHISTNDYLAIFNVFVVPLLLKQLKPHPAPASAPA